MSGHPRSASSTVKAEEVAARAAREAAGAGLRGSARGGAAPRDFVGALRAKLAAGAARGDRRDQEGEPEPGRAARALRAGGDRGELRAPRRGVPVGADRRAVLPGRARRPARGARGVRAAGPAQGFHDRSLPGARSAGGGRRLHPADRRRARARAHAGAGRRRARARAWRCWSKCTTPRSSSGRSRSRRRSSASTTATCARSRRGSRRRSTCSTRIPAGAHRRHRERHPQRRRTCERMRAARRRAASSWAKRSCARTIRARSSSRLFGFGQRDVCHEACHRLDDLIVAFDRGLRTRLRARRVRVRAVPGEDLPRRRDGRRAARARGGADAGQPHRRDLRAGALPGPGADRAQLRGAGGARARGAGGNRAPRVDRAAHRGARRAQERC